MASAPCLQDSLEYVIVVSVWNTNLKWEVPSCFLRQDLTVIQNWNKSMYSYHNQHQKLKALITLSSNTNLQLLITLFFLRSANLSDLNA